MSAVPPAVRRFCVVGGGTAGYFAAIALKRRFPQDEVTVVESPDIPIIGVGEATTPLLVPFLHRLLGIPPAELWAAVKPTWKLGIRFFWGQPGDYFFNYPFGDVNLLESYTHDGDIRTQSLVSLLMMQGKGPVIRQDDGSLASLLPRTRFAYHLDNEPFVGVLARHAKRCGVLHRVETIERVETPPEGGRVDALLTRSGARLTADVFIDASGFRSLLLEQTLGSPFISYASTLFCDTAVVGSVPTAEFGPYTLAESMDAGWCWRIPVMHEDHRGYVHSSQFLSVEQAEREMRAKNPGLGPTRVVRFRSGRHREFWKGNVVALGNAYGFVEPLESTALHMVITEVSYLLGALESPSPSAEDVAWVNGRVGGHWDYLRWFLGLHYKFNQKFETPFWKAARADVDVSGLQHVVDRYVAEGPAVLLEGSGFEPGDPTFGHHGLLVMLLGQKVPGKHSPPPVPASRWAAHLAEMQALADRALPQREALQYLREHPELLDAAIDAPDSWVNRSVEALVVRPRGRHDAGVPPDWYAITGQGERPHGTRDVDLLHRLS